MECFIQTLGFTSYVAVSASLLWAVVRFVQVV